MHAACSVYAEESDFRLRSGLVSIHCIHATEMERDCSFLFLPRVDHICCDWHQTG